jgi:hypothetical protein
MAGRSSFLIAQLVSDKRPAVSALATPLQAILTKIGAERAALEQVEDEMVVATAILNKNDRSRDNVLVEAGGVARATDKIVYETLFPTLSPSKTARLGIAAESAHVSRILGELAKLPAAHPIRVAYEKELIEAEADVKVADAKSDQATTALALQRSQLDRFKLEVDEARLETHGHLLTLFKDKEEADSFFRPTTNAPAAATNEAPADPATPAAAAPGAAAPAPQSPA